MYLTELKCKGVVWIHLATGRAKRHAFSNMVMYPLVPQNARNFVTEYLLGFAKATLCHGLVS